MSERKPSLVLWAKPAKHRAACPRAWQSTAGADSLAVTSASSRALRTRPSGESGPSASLRTIGLTGEVSINPEDHHPTHSIEFAAARAVSLGLSRMAGGLHDRVELTTILQ